MAGFTEEGEQVTFAGSKEANGEGIAVGYFINLPEYSKWYTGGRKALSTPSPSFEDPYTAHGDYGHQPMNPGYRRRNRAIPNYDNPVSFRSRKRPRGSAYKREGDNADDDIPRVPVVASKRGIKIGNDQEVWKFCDQRFKNIQQNACKTMAKAWVKLIAPKKQSNNPYTGHEEKQPDWWPKPWAPGKEGRVRHKEPDHLLKPERLYLLNHILHMLVEPNHKQHPDIQKLNLNVTKLEEATFEALSGFFADMNSPNNIKKKPYLKEIFKVAKSLERYKNGEIDAETEVYVTADDKVPETYESEEEDDDTTAKDHDESQLTPASSSMSSAKPPEHGMLPGPGVVQSPAGSLQGGTFISELPVRGGTYHQPQLLQPDLNASPTGYVEGGASLGVSSHTPIHQASSLPIQEPFNDPHASGRRPSLYAPTSEYGSLWQQTTAPSTAPVYAFNHHHQQQQQQQQQHPHTSAAYVEQPTVPMTQTPQYLEATSFDSMSRSSYDTGPGSLYRTANVAQGPVHPHPAQGFSTYHMSQDPRSLSGGGVKMEQPHARGHLPH